jgi:hypothetical protein
MTEPERYEILPAELGAIEHAIEAHSRAAELVG